MTGIFVRGAWRWFSGAPLDGVPKSNAGWITPASQNLTAFPVSRWSRLPRLKRAGIRTGSTVAVGTGAVSGLLWPAETAVTLGSVMTTGALYGSWRAYRSIRGVRHRNAWVRPLHRALAPIVGTPYSTAPEDWLHIPVGHNSGDGKPVRIMLPEGFSGLDSRKQIERLVCDRLGLSGAEASWRLAGRSPSVTFTRIPRPPKKVRLKDVRHLIDAASDAAPVIGVASGFRPVALDLLADNPHVGISAGTKSGKSVLARVALAQILRRGGAVITCDPKRTSQHWASDLPGVTYCRSGEAMHEAIMALFAEYERRSELVEQQPADLDIDNVDFTFVGPRVILLLEEVNLMEDALKSYWESVREKSDPKVSPAYRAIKQLLCGGRFVRIHVIGIAQMLTAQSIGGPVARENFGTRLLARYTVNNWRMLTPEVWPMPKASRTKGRWQVVIAGEATETQVVMMSVDEARAMALEWTAQGNPAPDPFHAPERGRYMPRVPVSQSPTVAPDLGEEDRAVSGGTLSGGAVVTLSQAVEQGIVAASLTNIRRLSTRDRSFPEPAGRTGTANLYRTDDLGMWDRNRLRVTAGPVEINVNDGITEVGD